MITAHTHLSPPRLVEQSWRIPLITTLKETTTDVAGMNDNLDTSKLPAIRSLWTPVIRCTGGEALLSELCVFTKIDPGRPGWPLRWRQGGGITAGPLQVVAGNQSGLQPELRAKGWRVCEVAYDLPIWLGRNSRALRGETSAWPGSTCVVQAMSSATPPNTTATTLPEQRWRKKKKKKGQRTWREADFNGRF